MRNGHGGLIRLPSKAAALSAVLIGSIVAGGIMALAGVYLALPSFDAIGEFLLVFVLAAEGCFAWAAFRQSKAQERSELLDSLYDRLDTSKARKARELLYTSSDEELLLAHLRDPAHREMREQVDDTIASFDRLAYQLKTLGLEGDDAFELWGGVVLQVANKVWPYVLEQRLERAMRSDVHQLLLRRYLEMLVRDWIPRYAKQIGVASPGSTLSTQEMLNAVFPSRHSPSSNVVPTPQ